jgi:hypothetical protein
MSDEAKTDEEQEKADQALRNADKDVREKLEAEGRVCLNCDMVLHIDMKFCHKCGQKNIDKKVRIRALFSDFTKDYLTFDSKFFRSFGPLLFRPGHLTKEYTKGRRVRFIPPIRLYLFVSFAFFFVTSFQEASQDGILTINGGDLITEQDSVAATPLAVGPGVVTISGSLPEELNAAENLIVDKALTFNAKTPLEKQQWVSGTFSLMMFILMPFFALVLMMFYGIKKRYYVEYLIFSFHIHAFFFLLQLLAMYPRSLTADVWWDVILGLGLLAYCFFALKKVYENKWWSTLLKLLGIVVVYSAGMGIIAALVIIGRFFTF